MRHLSERKYHPLDSQHPFVSVWRNMHARCFDPFNNRFKNYGARGITIEWETFQEFYDDMFISYQEGLQIDRERVNENYCKTNCRWVTPALNSQNRTNNKLTEIQAAEIRLRYKRGLSVALGKEFGVSSRMIRYVAIGDSWK